MMALDSERSGPERSSFARWTIRLGIGMIVVGLGAAVHAGAQHRVSQKDRAFAPSRLELQSGDSIEFVNDDGELLHHAYLQNERFSFDTGDQEPGSRSVIVFPTAGAFTVLCGIHPKMRLSVQVR